MPPLKSWLRRRSNSAPRLDRNTLVIGSGPSARLPEGFNEGWSLATVNASQAAFPNITPDVTLLGAAVLRNKPVNKEAKEVLRGRQTRSLVLIEGNQVPDRQRLRLLQIGYSYDTITFLSKKDRADCIKWATSIDDGVWPSNGIALGLICLYLGAEKIVYSGFSLSQAGHFYNDQNRPRLHVDADKRVIDHALTNRLPLFTNQKQFSAESGIPLLAETLPAV